MGPSFLSSFQSNFTILVYYYTIAFSMKIPQTQGEDGASYSKRPATIDACRTANEMVSGNVVPSYPSYVSSWIFFVRFPTIHA